jgi:predicted transcriptional regulator
MKALLIQLDEGTHRALDRVAPPSSRRRSQFVREAIRRAVREAEYARMREAYRARPDSETEADDWSTAEEYQP